MTWFKVCDSMWSHPKTIGLSPEAVALWVRAGSYSGNHLTNGFVANAVLPMVQGTHESAMELVEAGLWIKCESGYLFHDWEEYQPTREKVHDERAKTRERVAAYRAKKNDSSISLPVPTRPDPTRPVNSVTNGVSNTVTDDASNADTTPLIDVFAFEDFWDAYPRKAAKAAARKAWTTAVRKVPANTIIEAAKRYNDDVNREDAFTAHAATWLNQERWLDGPLPRRSGKMTAGEAKQAAGEEMLRRLRGEG